MIDRDFEKLGELLTPSGYFDRVRELHQGGLSIKECWLKVESELPFGLRRFETYTSFEHERKREADGVLRKPQFRLEQESHKEWVNRITPALYPDEH